MTNWTLAIIVASAGNGAKNSLGFPAADGRVFGVSGLDVRRQLT